MAATITDGKRAQVLDLIDAGMGRNATARETGLSAGQISRIARAAGRTFDRAATKAATDARQADLQARRVALADGLTADAERLRTELFTPAEHVTRDGETVTVSRPDGHQQRSIMTAAGIAISRSIDLVPVEREDDNETVRSMLGDLAAALLRTE